MTSSIRQSVSEPELRIEPFEGSPEEWDAFIADADDATFCHLEGWRQVIDGVLGHECLYWAARSEQEGLIGVLPMARVRSRIFGDYLVSMPFLSYGGPIGAREAQTRLAEEAATHATELGVDLLELRARHPVECGLRRSDRKITVVLPLPDSIDELEGAIRSSRRRQVRRAREQEMEVRFGPDQLEAFYGVFARNMRDLGTPVLPLAFFEAVRDAVGGPLRVAAVYWRGRPLAAGCGFAWRDELELTWVSSLYEHRDKYPNMLLYYAFMERCIGEGIGSFNFGRSTPGGSTHEFKRQWGTEDVPLPWLQLSGEGLEAPPTPEQPIYRTATRIWRRLPLPLANRLGPLLSKNIP